MSDAKRKYYIDETFFEVINTEEKAYVLGFLYGDGSMSRNDSNVYILSLKSDRQILEAMQKAMQSERPIREDGRGYIVLKFAGKKVKEDLMKVGVVPNKTKIIEFPYQHMDPTLYRHFIRGLFDSDGSITTAKDKRCSRYTAHWTIFSTRKMLDSIKSIMEEEGITTNNLTHDKRCYKESAILGTCKCESLYRIYNFLYKDQTICLERKRLRYEEALSRKPREGLKRSRS
jgi:DNA-binding transcriptional regulator WhiA